jgi:hypothetical protein
MKFFLVIDNMKFLTNDIQVKILRNKEMLNENNEPKSKVFI